MPLLWSKQSQISADEKRSAHGTAHRQSHGIIARPGVVERVHVIEHVIDTGKNNAEPRGTKRQSLRNGYVSSAKCGQPMCIGSAVVWYVDVVRNVERSIDDVGKWAPSRILCRHTSAPSRTPFLLQNCRGA